MFFTNASFGYNEPYIFEVNNTGSNATYSNDEDYYRCEIIQKIYSDREYIYDLYADNKDFGESELAAEEKIIERLSIEPKANFFDYYE